MSKRRAIIRKVAKKYQKAQKKEKGKMLNEFVETIGYTRCYVSYLLQNWDREAKTNCSWVMGHFTKFPFVLSEETGLDRAG